MGGIFGVYSPNPLHAADLIYLGLYALQHRGQESAGIVVADGERLRVHKGMGLVSQVFDDGVLGRLTGRIGLGHVRYARSGAGRVASAQPLLLSSRYGQIALAYSGSLTNAARLQRELRGKGLTFQSATDTEVIVNLLTQEPSGQLEEALLRAVRQVAGGFALAVMSGDRLIGVRDALGIRPLSIGRRDDVWFLASESCAFDTVGAQRVRDVEPGEMVTLDERGLTARRFAPAAKEAFCVFEYIYFARPDSVIEGRSVHEVRKEIGRALARQHRIEADVVVPVPDSALSAALGYAEESGLPFEMGLAKNRYVGRTFIQPTQSMREIAVQIKLNPIAAAVRGKRLVLVDDSIVRGTTTAKVIGLLRKAGAAEVHMAVASPPFSHPCHYGIDVPTPDELIASERSVDEVCRMIGADSLVYLSFDSLYQAVGIRLDRLCTACLGGGYPIASDGEAAPSASPRQEERAT